MDLFRAGDIVDLSGTHGNDVLAVTAAIGSLAGGAGNDVLVFSPLLGLCEGELYGGTGNDVLIGGGALSYLYGGAGNDRLFSRGDYNAMVGGVGHDTFILTPGHFGEIEDYRRGIDHIDVPRGSVFLPTFVIEENVPGHPQTFIEHNVVVDSQGSLIGIIDWAGANRGDLIFA